MMTPKEFHDAMETILRRKQYYDEAKGHREMDELMCTLLEELGYANGVTLFRNAERWYE